MLYDNVNNAPWDKERWPNFSPREFSCKCGGKHCDGEFWYDPDYFDALQRLRTKWGQPIRINCGHRCRLHNAEVGGAPLSEHKELAFDVSIRGIAQPARFYRMAREAGFTSFGFYSTFIHMDLRRPARMWYGSTGAKKQWQEWLKS